MKAAGGERQGLLDRPGIWFFAIGPLAASYGVAMGASGRLHALHVAVLGFVVILSYVGRLHGVLKLLLPFAIFAVVYDGLRYVTPIVLAANSVHVAEPYLLESYLFGATGGVPATQLVVARCQSVALDLLAAFAYVFYIVEVLLFAAYLLLRDRPLLQRFAWSFLLLNLLGFATYLLYPAAPPWYVAQYGMGPAVLDAPASAARLIEIDHLLGIAYFQTVYSQSSAVFGALPSLHAAYPLLVWLHARRVLPRLGWLLLSFWLLVCFSAVYLGHHYVIDVLLGAVYSALIYSVMEVVALSHGPTRAPELQPITDPSVPAQGPSTGRPEMRPRG